MSVTKNAFLCGALNGALFQAADDVLVNHQASSWQVYAQAASVNGLLGVGAGWAGYGLSKITKPAWTWLENTFGKDAAKAGPGAWSAAAESMSARAAAYQAQITGRAAGSAYWVNGVKFDGFLNGVLQDAKSPGYARFIKNGTFQPWFRGADELVDQAQRQVRAAEGVPITWSVAEESAASAIRRLFDGEGIVGITVVCVPAR